MALSDLIVTLRTLAQDAADSKVIFGEQLGTDPSMPVDGSNRVFRLKSTPVVGSNGAAGSVYVNVIGTGAVFRSQSGFTITDIANGIITFSVAPNPGNTSGAGVYADYNYYWFSDAKYTEWLNQGTENLKLNQTPADPTTVATGLQPAMMQYAFGYFCNARAAQYAERYSSSGGEAGQSVESVAKTYRAMAKDAFKRGDELRDAYYQNQGQRLQSAFSNPATYKAPSIDPITPRR